MTGFLAEARSKYEQQLHALGFERRQDGSFVGTPFAYPGTDRRPTLQIILPEGFPYARPQVFVLEPEFTSASWHLNALSDDGRGYLCLYGHDGRNSDYPWSDPVLLLERIWKWFENDALGWPDDPPVLEVNAYLSQSEDQLIVDPRHLEADEQRPLMVRRRRHPAYYSIWETSREGGYESTAGSWFGEAIPATVINVGEIAKPPRDVKQVLAAASAEEQATVRKLLDEHAVVAVIFRYSRSGNSGLHGFHMSRSQVGNAAHAFRAVYELSPERLRLRSGRLADVLADTSIAVVGLGAVGSFLADALVRSGARWIDFYDSDILAPGNCIRHLCSREYVGLWKSHAARSHLISKHGLEDFNLKAYGSLLTPTAVKSVLRKHWVTIDATADETASGLLIDAASDGARLISVCVLGDGEYVRADRWPADQPHLPAPPLRPLQGGALYEAGCGDPVSPTPPYVAQMAAALGCRMVLDLLRPDGPSLPSTVLQEAS